MLLLSILLSLGECSCTIKDAERLATLLQYLPVIASQAHRVAHKVKHLNILKRLQGGAGLSEVAQLVKCSIKAEQVREITRDSSHSCSLQHIVRDSKMDKRVKGLAQRLN